MEDTQANTSVKQLMKCETRTLNLRSGFIKRTHKVAVDRRLIRLIGNYQMPDDYVYKPDEQSKIINFFKFINETKGIFEELCEINPEYVKNHPNYNKAVEILKMDTIDLNVKYNVKILTNNEGIVTDIIKGSRESLEKPRKIPCFEPSESIADTISES